MTDEKLALIEGSAPHTQFTSEKVGPVDPDREIDFVLMLRTNPNGKLAEAMKVIKDIVAQRIDVNTFHELIKASPKDLITIRSFAEKYELEIIKEIDKTRGVKLRGKPPQIKKAFGVDLNEYRVDGQTFFGHEQSIGVPESILKIIEAVIGLDNFPIGNSPNSTPYRIPDPIYTPAQIETLYNFPENKGEGVTLGVWALGGGYHQEDLDNYYRTIGLTGENAPQVEAVGNNNPAPLPEVKQCVEKLWGAGDMQASYNVTWTVETTQDIEVASALAPRAKILVFLPSTEVGGMTGLGLIESLFEILLETRPIDVMTASWAYLESTVSKPFKRILNLFLHAMTKLRGVTFCFSSGDWGSQEKEQLEPSFPSTSPYVISCGGTRLDANEAKTEITTETVWNNTYNNTFFSSTGGVSTFFDLPDWQKNAQVEQQTGSAMRGIPDIAANADFHTGMILVIGTVQVGSAGTSASAPLFAALLARIMAELGTHLGHLNPTLYEAAVAATFRHVVATNNYQTGTSLEKYVAGSGWNPCTGLGSPNGQQLLAALKTYYGQSQNTEQPTGLASIVAKIKNLF